MAARREPAKPAHWRFKITFLLDVTLLVSICALQTARFTGLVLHEWLGLAMVGMVLAHLLLALELDCLAEPASSPCNPSARASTTFST
jgi:hypothetical protein